MQILEPWRPGDTENYKNLRLSRGDFLTIPAAFVICQAIQAMTKLFITWRIKMTAYIVLDIEVKNADRYAEYRGLASPTVAQCGGKYIVRGGRAENLEGDWSPSRIVILQFESVEQAKKWLNSPEYKPAMNLRHQTAVTRSIIVEGV
jgi:uncharacterized protein (DUF1330 family)